MHADRFRPARVTCQPTILRTLLNQSKRIVVTPNNRTYIQLFHNEFVTALETVRQTTTLRYRYRPLQQCDAKSVGKQTETQTIVRRTEVLLIQRNLCRRFFVVRISNRDKLHNGFDKLLRQTKQSSKDFTKRTSAR